MVVAGVPSSRMTRSPAARLPGVWPPQATSKATKYRARSNSGPPAMIARTTIGAEARGRPTFSPRPSRRIALIASAMIRWSSTAAMRREPGPASSYEMLTYSGVSTVTCS